jgi:dTMP kinase
LLYATDLCDRLERAVVPALRAGMVVLADRYIFTMMARAVVRGIAPEWVERLYDFAPVPNQVFYLDTNIDVLMPRVVRGDGFGYWESGLDQLFDWDRQRSFVRYQQSLLAEYRWLAERHGFTMLDACQSQDEVFVALKDRLEATFTSNVASPDPRPSSALVLSSAVFGDESNEKVEGLVPILAHSASANGHRPSLLP